MGTILRQVWQDAEVGKVIMGTGFGHWSEPVVGEADHKASNYRTGFFNWIGKVLFWRKLIVLVPEGPPDRPFVVAFRDSHGVCKCSSRIRRVSDGPFMMRMGPYDCRFYVVGVIKFQLKKVGYVRGGIDLY